MTEPKTQSKSALFQFHLLPLALLLVCQLLSVSVIVVEAQEVAALQVATEAGLVQGTYLNTSRNELLAGFFGVPYARPPIGDLRFREPQDPLSWSGVKNTDKIPNSCFQRKDFFFADFLGATALDPTAGMSEDCLYLNVYIPNVKSRPGVPESAGGPYANGLPVLVWFHGGGFTSGSAFPQGSGDWSPDPREFAVLGEVMVVTVQYRLGSFGFLFLDDNGAPGNVGLLDQKKALEWIKRNIFAFGGDPTRVTLAGQDAGGISAAIQLLGADEQDERLFQRMIIHSAGRRRHCTKHMRERKGKSCVPLHSFYLCDDNQKV